MSTPEVTVVRTNIANLSSVLAGLHRLGVSVTVTEDPSAVRAAARLVLPGVGSFGAAMGRLHELGLVEPLVRRIREGAPTLAVCLGMQLLCEASAESEGSAGLGVLPLKAKRFGAGVRVPHLGWNFVQPDVRGRFITGGYAYFANSFYVPEVPEGWVGAEAVHGERFVAALERGGVLACQFHPELSGAWGSALLERWLSGEPSSTYREPSSTHSEPSSTYREPSSTYREPSSTTFPERSGALAVRPRIIPCLDVKDGRVVKGVRFSGLKDAGDPAELAGAYEQQGADELVVLDVSATPEGRRTRYDTVRAVRERISIPLTVGGGVRGADDAQALLEAGADKVGVNTAAVHDPELLSRLAERFGRQCVVLAIDAQRADQGWKVVVRSGTEQVALDVVDWAKRATELGAGEVLLTSWDRDGTQEGYDLELLREVSAAVTVPVIASGGAASAEHLRQAIDAGADAALAASIFHFGQYTVEQVKRFLFQAGIEVRP